jgi:flagellar basal body-associated protein FliL
MAFCNSCGATLNDGTKFCNKCGAVVAAPAVPIRSTPVTASPVATTPTSGGSGALKIILIVVAVIVVIGILGVGAVTFIGYRIAKSTHVRQDGDNVNVETPFGSVKSTKDPEKVAKDLGIDIYPGAELQKDSASSASFGSLRTVAASFESSDSMDKVCAFYKAKLPGAMSTRSDENQCNISANMNKATFNIQIETSGDGSQFKISKVTTKASE